MKIIWNNVLPPKGFLAINIFGLFFARKEYKNKISKYQFNQMINHESIHTAQMKETLYVGFYIWYFIEWLIRLIICLFKGYHYRNAYYAISFEREAYINEDNFNYLKHRKHYNWFKNIKKHNRIL